MKFARTHKILRLLCQLVLLWSLSGLVSAEIIDDVTFKTDAKGEVDVTIDFTVPIQYLRHFPRGKSPEMVIYFGIPASVPRERWLNYESNRSPVSSIVRIMQVSTRDMNTGPKIMFQFHRPAEFSVTPGRNNQSIQVHIKPGVVGQQGNGASTGLPVAMVPPVPPLVVVPPVVAPVPATPKTAVAAAEPTVAASAAATTAQPQSPDAIKPLPERVPETVKPAAKAVAPVVPVPVAAQLGGKDGLPLFPKLDPVTKEVPVAQPAEILSVAEQLKKSNNQAAALMGKGRDGMLKGELFTAIDAFNAVLNLPPNKYSADAQLWIGIARERTGQQAKARLEFESYLKLYPDGTETAWVRQRLSRLPAAAPLTATASVKPAKPQATKFEFNQYGSLSTYYHTGKSWTNSTKTENGVDVPDNSQKTDLSSLITQVSMTGRAYNNRFDNRLVFQANKSHNLLDSSRSRSRISAAFYDLKNRVDDYSGRIGIQSALGGGVLGRFLGISAGYGFSPNWRANVSVGEMTEDVLGQKPQFLSSSLDFGVNSPLGGSVYFIDQAVEGITDRRAVGGNLRYFEQGKSALAMLDYDVQFKSVNIFSWQGTLNYDSGTDYNVMLDHRRSPSLSVMNAVYGAGQTSATQFYWVDPNDPTRCLIDDPFYDPVNTPGRNPCQADVTFAYTPSTLAVLLQNGFTVEDLIELARKRTAISNQVQFGVSQRIEEKWQVGADIVASNTSGMPESGDDNGDSTTGLAGYFPATPSSGTTWTFSGRLSGTDVIAKRDQSTLSLSFSKSPMVKSSMLYLNNRSYPSELWTLDGTLRGMWQSDTLGGKQTASSMAARIGYNWRTNFTWEVELGVDWMKISYSTFNPATIKRGYASSGFRWDF